MSPVQMSPAQRSLCQRGLQQWTIQGHQRASSSRLPPAAQRGLHVSNALPNALMTRRFAPCPAASRSRAAPRVIPVGATGTANASSSSSSSSSSAESGSTYQSGAEALASHPIQHPGEEPRVAEHSLGHEPSVLPVANGILVVDASLGIGEGGSAGEEEPRATSVSSSSRDTGDQAGENERIGVRAQKSGRSTPVEAATSTTPTTKASTEGTSPSPSPSPSAAGQREASGASDGQGSGLSYVVQRVIWGSIIGSAAFSAVLRGGWAFSSVLGLICAAGTWEFFGLVRLRCATRGLVAPSVGAAAVMSLAAGFMPLVTLLYGGQVVRALGLGTAALAAVLLLQPTRPRMSEITSLAFGSIYCGVLASFWVKLRSEAWPAVASAAAVWPPVSGPVSPLQSWLVRWWPTLLGGGVPVVSEPQRWTLGLAATFLGFAGIIAADTGAYMGGKLMGRTPLINVSPNKTWEGALSGLCCCILVSLWVSKSLLWPAPPFWTAVMASLVFLAALFGDLSESMLKRDAGVKDAGRLIPGHGGVLDRTDSYIFTGLTVFAFVRFVLPRVVS